MVTSVPRLWALFRERVLETLGYSLFSQSQDVAHLLRVRAQPQVAEAHVGVQDVAALDHTGRPCYCVGLSRWVT